MASGSLCPDMNGGVPQISILGMALSLLPVIAVAWFFHRWCSGGKLLLYATTRMVVQLFAIGFLLVYLFDNPSLWIGASVLVVIIGASAWIGMRPIKASRGRKYLVFVGALAISGCPVLLLDLLIVQGGEWVYFPKLFIPLAGMVFGNAMNSLSLAAERFETELDRSEDFAQARRIAFNASMIPQINTFLAVGMVSLPGMMTGQILAGVSPLVAVRYQILIMGMVMGSAGLTVALYFILTGNRNQTAT